MFKENPDGSLSVSLSGYTKTRGGGSLRNRGSYEVTDARREMKQYNKKRLAFQYEAIRMLEMCADKTLKHDAYLKIKDRYELFKNYLDEEVLELDRFKYSKEEREAFLNIVGDINDYERITENFISLDDAFSQLKLCASEYIDGSVIDTTLASLDDGYCIEEEEKYLIAVLERYRQYFLDNPELKHTLFEGFLTKNCLMAARNSEKEFDYLDGGDSYLVFKKLGFEAERIDKDGNEEAFSSIFLDPDMDSKYVVSASCERGSRSPFIKPSHVYSIYSYNLNGTRIVAANDPHNAASDILMTPECASKVFDRAYIAKIK